jgi:hypothetical protein
MAVETAEKPAWSDKCRKYPPTLVAEKLGFGDDRVNVSWNDAHTAVVREKQSILVEVGLSGHPADLRFLEALEWNLLANRQGWGKTDPYVNGQIPNIVSPVARAVSF